MTTTDTLEKLKPTIEALSKLSEFKEVVDKIEGGIKTTKDNYGRYISFLSHYQDEGISFMYCVGEALKNNGANHAGVAWALRLLS